MSKDVTGNESLYRVRDLKNKAAMVLSCAATAFGLLWLVWILLTTIINGVDALNLRLFSGMTPPPGVEGGLANAFYGSVLMSGIGLLIGTPIGLMGWRVAGGVRPLLETRQRGALRQRHSVVRPFDRSRPVCLHRRDPAAQ
jgi:hypothetical protein